MSLCLCLQCPSVTGQICTVRQRACFPLNSFTLFHSHGLVCNYTNIYFDFPKKTIRLTVQYCFIIDALTVYYIVPSNAPVNKKGKASFLPQGFQQGNVFVAALHNLRNGFTYYIDCAVILLSLQCSAHVCVEPLMYG